MREYYCDLCGEMIGVAHADFQKTTNNELHMVTWIDMPRQREKIRCAYDLCDDCAKRIHRKLIDIQNNHRWRHGTRPWSETKEAQEMTIERAIQILDPEHREHYDSIETVNEACRMGMAALRAQLEAEENEPLTLDELWSIDGDTDKIQILMLKGAGEWKNVDAANGRALLFGLGALRFADYGKTWFAYRRPPKERKK